MALAEKSFDYFPEIIFHYLKVIYFPTSLIAIHKLKFSCFPYDINSAMMLQKLVLLIRQNAIRH